jgi:hypothetical protein
VPLARASITGSGVAWQRCGRYETNTAPHVQAERRTRLERFEHAGS